MKTKIDFEDFMAAFESMALKTYQEHVADREFNVGGTLVVEFKVKLQIHKCADERDEDWQNFWENFK